MSFLKNRTVIGVVCILLSLIICFVVTPLFNQSMSERAAIVRVVKPVEKGEVITAEKVNVVEAGSYNLPEDTAKNADTVIGKYACADFAPGDSILLSKIAEEPIAENAYLYQLNGEKQAISVSVKAFANGLSGKLQSGDIVSVIAPDYRKQGLTVIPAELQYVEVIAVTANSGYDANTGDKAEEDSEKELPGTVTLLVTPEQSRLLAELEADGKLHLSLVYRGGSRECPGIYHRPGDGAGRDVPSGGRRNGRRIADKAGRKRGSREGCCFGRKRRAGNKKHGKGGSRGGNWFRGK